MMRILLAIVLCTILASPASAQLIFFGEDLGLGEATRLPATPNADAARTNFLSNLVGVGTEDFEITARLSAALRQKYGVPAAVYSAPQVNAPVKG